MPNATQNRRRFIQSAAAGLAAAAWPAIPFAQEPRLKVGLMLPYTGTYAALGIAIANGFKLAVQDQGGKLGGRGIDYVTLDDESDPAKGADRANQLVNRDKVDVIVGSVHSGVQMGIVKIARESGVLNIIPNAGVEAATTTLCAPNIFRTSFANGQPAYPMGKYAADKGHRNVVTLAWKYGAGEESVAGFKDSFQKAGGKVTRELWVPFPNVEFQALLTEIASLKPDAVFVFFAGGGAAKFVKDWQGAGLKGKIPLYSTGFLTDGVLESVGNAAEGLETTLHYGDGIDTPRNKSFQLAYAKTFKLQPDVYAVQGYDAGQLLGIGLKAVKGDMSRKKEMYAAMGSAVIDSPRGKWKMSTGHNPVQDMFIRKVVGTENRVTGVAMKALDYPSAATCKMPV
ncbi:MAG TPA: ABC transporter substrate-binding protein [Burkholderiales bacterium]|nr:ABC transporter substrate-binding protein [Burkholderiales bacterium]